MSIRKAENDQKKAIGPGMETDSPAEYLVTDA